MLKLEFPSKPQGLKSSCITACCLEGPLWANFIPKYGHHVNIPQICIIKYIFINLNEFLVGIISVGITRENFKNNKNQALCEWMFIDRVAPTKMQLAMLGSAWPLLIYVKRSRPQGKLVNIHIALHSLQSSLTQELTWSSEATLWAWYILQMRK